MNAVSIITRKRDGYTLSDAEIGDLLAAYTRGDVPDYQMAAFLMASFLNGLEDSEASALTQAMLHSGEVLDLSDLPGIKVDKHSTGGVGDKISLILAPLVASCGVPVPMISGRGLGHTGGTLDKLESIPGFNVNLSIAEYRDHLERMGVVMIGQTEEIAPADRKLYALRDVTGTVECIPLIAASIMSKKLAEGIDALVLDVKSGRGAFMKEEAAARKLTETLVGIGKAAGKPTVGLLTDMNAPLGRAVGNWPEVVEATSILHHETPPGGPADDVLEVTLALAGEMLRLGGKANSVSEGIGIARSNLENGLAFEKWVELVNAQGGDASVLNDPASREGYSVASTISSTQAGFVASIDSLELGLSAVALGAGRVKKEDEVDPIAGFVLNKVVGSPVEVGETLATVYASEPSRLDAEAVRQAFSITSEPSPLPTSRLIDRYDGTTWAGIMDSIS
ncbi:MAG: thymidine phosphorylase [Rubricoccaceae bacterium]|nr:thymidine phosphorylase [Rubricoccaceae bacterium]